MPKQTHTIPQRLIGTFRALLNGQRNLDRIMQRIAAANEAARILTMTERGRTPRLTTKDGRPARPVETRPRAGRVQTVKHYGSTGPGTLERGGFYIVQLGPLLNRRARLSTRSRAERCAATRRAEPQRQPMLAAVRA